MKLLSDQIQGMLSGSSAIRKMFEAGIELKKKYGAENVYDFSLGNPDLPAPPSVEEALAKITAEAQAPFAFGYMPNAGYPEMRQAMARRLSKEQNFEVPASRIIGTCGAAGGLNVFFRAVLSAGDEVLCPSPYFVEYGNYAANFGGKLVPVPTKLPDFTLDFAAIEQAVTEKTRAIIVNSPNNPTGQIYSKEELAQLGDLMRRCSEKNNRTIYIVSDEPYRFLNFDHVDIPCIFSVYDASVIVGSFSKSLSLAGERAGYLAVNPQLEHGEDLVSALILTNRILGFINTPAIAQKILIACEDSQVDTEIYHRRRTAMAQVLTDAGISFTMPRGAFYFFPKSPVEDESVFISALLNERVLAVAGKGFGLPGYFRLAFCVSEKTIRDSADSFRRAVRAVSGQ